MIYGERMLRLNDGVLDPLRFFRLPDEMEEEGDSFDLRR